MENLRILSISFNKVSLYKILKTYKKDVIYRYFRMANFDAIFSTSDAYFQWIFFKTNLKAGLLSL